MQVKGVGRPCPLAAAGSRSGRVPSTGFAGSPAVTAPHPTAKARLRGHRDSPRIVDLSIRPAYVAPMGDPLPEQQRFIERDAHDAALLVAGPGTGKTFTIERRARFLVEECGVDPDRIALLTLTRSLAESLAKRVPYGRAQTFHSFALTWLNKFGDAWDRRVVAPADVAELVRLDLQHGAQLSFEVTIPRDRIGKFLGRMSAAFREEQDQPPDMTAEEQRLLQVFQHQRELFRYRLMDELTFDLIRLIEQGAEVDDAPTHILCDEYQDFTAGELRLLQLFSERFQSVVEVCGDDRQSIFRFRAADPLALHRFPQAYGLAEVDYLWRSSRCPAVVCDLANRMAEALPPLDGLDRPALEPWADREDLGILEVVVASSPITEARWVVQRCTQLVAEGRSSSEIIVVAAGYVDDVLAFLGQASSEVEGLAFSFYDPRRRSPFADDVAVKLLSAGSRLLMSSDDQMAWRRLVAETPSVGEIRLKRILAAGRPTYLECLRHVGESDDVCLRPVSAGDTLIRTFADQEVVAGAEVVALVAAELGIEDLDVSTLNSLIGDEVAASPSDWFSRVLVAAEPTRDEPGDVPDAIPVLTIFGAKGLEAPVVFLTNAMTPSFTRGGDVADGIRRAYVGATRAKSHLIVSAPLHIRHSTLEHKVDARTAGLSDIFMTPAQQMGIDVQTIRAGDITR